jgi:hypothetical protein
VLLRTNALKLLEKGHAAALPGDLDGIFKV